MIYRYGVTIAFLLFIRRHTETEADSDIVIIQHSQKDVALVTHKKI